MISPGHTLSTSLPLCRLRLETVADGGVAIGVGIYTVSAPSKATPLAPTPNKVSVPFQTLIIAVAIASNHAVAAQQGMTAVAPLTKGRSP